MALITPESVWRMWETMGMPESGKHEPKKAEIIQLFNMLFSVSRGGWVVAKTAAELNGVTPAAETDGGVVLTGVGAGYYQRDAGVWVRERGFPDTAAQLVGVAGTGNAPTASTVSGVDPAQAVMLFFTPRYRNTGAMTLSVNGAAAKPLLSFDGLPMEEDFLAADATVPVYDNGTEYRLLWDHRWETLAAQTLAARNLVVASVDAAARSETNSELSAEAAALSAEESLASEVRSRNAAEASGSVVFFDTKAMADAGVGVLPANQIVEVFNDETRGGGRSRYRKEGGVLVFKIVSTAYLNLSGVSVDEQPGATFADKFDAARSELLTRTGGYLRMKPNQTVSLNRKIRIPIGYSGYDFAGAKIDCSAMPDTQGRAIEIIPDAWDYRNVTLELDGLWLVGASDEAKALDGIVIGRPADLNYGNTSGIKIAGIQVEGFRDNLTFGAHAWLVSIEHFKIADAWRRGLGFGTGAEGAFNSGEQMSFKDGVFANNRNAAKNAVCAEIALGYAGTITFGSGVSWDYSDQDLIVRAGLVNLLAPHMENNAALPNIKRIYTDGQSHPPQINIIGGTGGKYWAALAIPEEPTGGKVCFIENQGSGAGGIAFSGGFEWDTFDRYNTELVKSDSFVPLDFSGVVPITQTNATPYLSKRHSAAKDPLFTVDPPNSWLGPMENHCTNGAMDGTSPFPTGFSAAGGVAGVTQTVTIDLSAGRPRLKVVLSGTPTATGAVGVYMMTSTAIVAGPGQRWTGSAYVQFEASAGADNVQISMVERSAAGAGTGSSVTTHAVSRARKRRTGSRQLSASAERIQYAVQVSVTNTVPVAATYYIDTPTLFPEHVIYEDQVYDTHAGAVPPTLRSWRASAEGLGGSAALAISNGGSGSGGRYQDIPILPGKRLWVRGMFKGTISAGSYGLRVEWIGADGVVIETRDMGGLITTTQAAYIQRGDIRPAPEGTVKARVWAYSVNLSGTIYVDEIYAWVL